MTAQSKAACISASDGRVSFSAPLGFHTYWANGVDVLVFLIQEDKDAGETEGWVPYVMDLADGDVRFNLTCYNLRHSPEWFRKHPFFKTCLCDGQEGRPKFWERIDGIFLAPPPDCIRSLVENRYSLSDELRELVKNCHLEVHEIYEQTKKRGFHPNNSELIFQEAQQVAYIKKVGAKAVKKFLKQKVQCMSCYDAYLFQTRVALQALYGFASEDMPIGSDRNKRARFGPCGEELDQKTALKFLEAAAQYEEQRGQVRYFGVHYMSAMNALFLGIYGETKRGVVKIWRHGNGKFFVNNRTRIRNATFQGHLRI